MSSVIVSGDTSGTVTLQAPAVAGSTVVNLPSTSMNMGNGGGNVATNTAFGASALAANTTGATNTAIGNVALTANISGSRNTAVGHDALFSNTTASDNTAIGWYALGTNTTGASNTALGKEALQSNTTASANTAVGYQSGYSNTTGAITAVGAQALRSNTTGQSNTAVGGTYNANPPLYANTTGSFNSAFGEGALSGNTTASANTAVGYQAAYSLTGTGLGCNTVMGHVTGFSMTTGAGNSFFGRAAGYSATTGNKNTFVGGSDGNTNYGSGYFVTTGSSNTILGCYNGNQGGLDIRTASNYIVLSDGDGNPRQVIDGIGQPIWGPGVGNGVSGINTASFAYDGSLSPILTFNNNYAGGTKSALQFKRNSTVVGSITENGTNTSYNTSSDYRLKNITGPMVGALERNALLQPKVGTWKSNGSPFEGFLAHELKDVFDYAAHGEKDEVDADGNPVYQGVGTGPLDAHFAACINELKAMIEAQAAEIAALKGTA